VVVFERDGVCVVVVVRVADKEAVAESETDRVVDGDGLSDGENDLLLDLDAVNERLSVLVYDDEMDDVCVSDVVAEFELVGVLDTDGDAVRVIEEDEVLDGDPEAEGLRVRLHVVVTDTVAEAVTDSVKDRESVLDIESTRDFVGPCVAVGYMDDVGDEVWLGDRENVALGVVVAEFEAVLEFDADRESESVAVCDADTVTESVVDIVEERVTERDVLCVGDKEKLFVFVWDEVAERLAVYDRLLDAEADGEMDDDSDLDGVFVGFRVTEREFVAE
jgi:hypothetical protein